jgi:hypothetical protein
MMNRLRKEKLKENIEKLDPQEHAQVFSIVRKYTEDYTKTQTGVLVSSDTLSDACLIEIETLVSYCLDQRKQFDFTRRQ